MYSNAAPIIYVNDPVKHLLYVGVFCFGIAALLWLLSGDSFVDTLCVSLCIGWSISLAFMSFGNLMQRWVNSYVAPIPITIIGLVVGMLLAGTLVYTEPTRYFSLSEGTLFIGVFFGIVGFFIFNTRGRLMEAQAQLAEATIAQAKQAELLTQTELKLLQAQIEPHFLFNTLSNIIGLIHRDPETAETTLINLTTLLRASLKRTRETQTTLAEEIAIARAYLEIQATRMKGRLSFDVITDPNLEQVILPPLLVQPLIENAIKHGIEQNEDGGHIQLLVKAEAENIMITVADTGKGIEATSPGQTGTGLSNIRNRLEILYGQRAKLVHKDNVPCGTIACLEIPR